MSLAALVELTRNGVTENVHFGAIAVVNHKGKLVASAGNAQWHTFSRSTLKAFQTLPFMESGGDVALKFDSRDIAMMCASHSGEEFHVHQVDSMLRKIGQDYDVLECGCHEPYVYSTLNKPAPQSARFDERYNNCSGKHTGFVACCVHKGFHFRGYTDPAHPVQREIARDVARAVRVDEAKLSMGIDGCSAPNYAMPLSSLALAYARLTQGEGDSEFGASFAKLRDAMLNHPELISGTGRNDEAYALAGRGDWIAKIGAEAVQVVASVSRGEAFAIKIVDGNKQALYAATIETMDQLGWLDDLQRVQLDTWRARSVRNVRKLVVGERRAVFKLQRHAA